jgi:GNAT superfamily N-acetyltransferase
VIEIRRVGYERIDDIVGTLAAGFADDPFIGWVLADSPYEPREAQLRWWTGALAAMSKVAVIHANQESSAVAVWVPPVALDSDDGDDSAEEVDDGSAFVELVRDVCGGEADERLGFFADLYAAGPPEPHWHLTAVAVAPRSQNKGLGRKVIEPMLSQCDRLGVPAYLEATTPRSRTLYESLGFETTSVVGPVGAPKLALMWREPQSQL